MLSRSLIATTAGALVASVLAVPAFAGPTPPEFLMTWDVSNDGIGENTYNWDPANGGLGQLNPFGDYTVPKSKQVWTGWNYTGELFGPNNAWALQWNCVFYDASSVGAAGESAFVVANIVVTNFSQNTENFSLLMSQPLARAINPTWERGSIVGTVTDLTNDDATVSAPLGTSIYTALIDTMDESFLMTDPFSASAGGPFQSGTVGPEDFGVPGIILASKKAETSIGIFLNFDLSAGDSASFTAIYEVLIPAPAGLPVLAAFGLLGIRRRRRA